MPNHSAKEMRLLADSVFNERVLKIPIYSQNVSARILKSIEGEAAEGRHKLLIISKAMYSYCEGTPHDFVQRVFDKALDLLKEMGYKINNDSTYTVISWGDAE